MSHSTVGKSGNSSWMASLMKQLLTEVRVAPLGVAGRARVAEIHRRSISKLERSLSLEVVDELNFIALPFCGQVRRDAGRVGRQDGHVSRVDRLLDNIETAQIGQLSQLSQKRRQQQRKGAPKASS